MPRPKIVQAPLCIARDHWGEIVSSPGSPYAEQLKAALKRIKCSDLGLVEPINMRDWTTARYVNLYHDDNIDIGVFLLPKGQKIPLHNHPAMTVFTRVLSGTIDVRSLDWADLVAPAAPAFESSSAAAAAVNPSSFEQVPDHAGLFHARVTHHRRYSAESSIIEIHPRRCNLHEIRALENSAFIDIAMPSYSDERACTYFAEEPNLEGLRVASDCSWSMGGEPGSMFRQCACPLAQRTIHLRVTKSDYEVQAEPYRGPRIVLPPVPAPCAAAAAAVAAAMATIAAAK
eukprot:m.36812 g.36812  ORF g.36812 m.36812 type:complete len:287 (+) comp9720_c0_seq1:367-1227(+)